MQTKKTSLRKNFIANAAMTGLNFLIPLVTLPYSSRTLGPEGIGRVGFALSVVGIFSMFAGLIGTVYGTREVARVRDDRSRLSKTVSELLAINFISYALALGIFLLSVFIVPRFYREWPIFLIASMVLLSAAINVDWLFQGLEEYGFIFWRNLCAKLLSVVLLLALVKTGRDVVPYALVSVSALLIGNVWNLVGASRRIQFIRKGLSLRPHLKQVGMFYLINMLTIVTVNFDKTFIGFSAGDSQLGLYTLADKVIFLGVSITSSLSVVLLPRVANAFARDDHDELRRGLDLSWAFAMMLALPLSAGTMIMSSDIARLLGGEEFSAAGKVLAALSPNIFLLSLAHIFGIQILCGRSQEKYYLASLISAVAALAIAMAILTPKFGAFGGALAVTLSCAVQVTLQLASSWKVFKKIPNLRNDLKILIAVIAMSIFVNRALKAEGLASAAVLVRFIFGATAGLSVYVVCLLALRETFLVKALRHLRASFPFGRS